jgi:hypothetical protein
MVFAAAMLPGTSVPASAAAVTATQTCNNVLVLPDASFEACVTASFEADTWRPGYSYATASATVRRDIVPTGSAAVQITLTDVIVHHGWNTANTAWEAVARAGYPVVGTNSVAQNQSTRSSYSNTAGHAFRGCIKWQAPGLGEQLTCTKPALLG